MSENLTIEQYLKKIEANVDNPYGMMYREQFADSKGSSELGMLVSPSSRELEGLRRAVAIMTESEKSAADRLDDEQIRRIADDAGTDPANFAIFVNGYCLAKRKAKNA